MSLGHARRTVVHVSVDTLRMKLEAGASGDRCEACQHTPSEVHCYRLKSDCFQIRGGIVSSVQTWIVEAVEEERHGHTHETPDGSHVAFAKVA